MLSGGFGHKVLLEPGQQVAAQNQWRYGMYIGLHIEPANLDFVMLPTLFPNLALLPHSGGKEL